MFCAQPQFERRICRKTRHISPIVFLLFANHCLKLRNKKSIEGARRQISWSSNQIALSVPTSRSVQSDRSFRTNKSERPIRSLFQDQQVGSSNQIALSGPTSRSVQSQLSLRTYFPYRPIRYILRTYFPYGPIRYFLRTYLLYRPIRSLLRTYWSYKPIRSLGRLSNRYKRSQSSESSTRSDGQTLKLKSLTRKSRTLYA